jgi:magnesium-transporting ATPase (P-type)
MDDERRSDGLRSWHSLPARAAFEGWNSSERGLTAVGAWKRLGEYGPNLLPSPRGRGPLRRFAEQFNNVLIYVLLISAAITATLAEWADTGVILGVVVINAFVGFIQEGKAERALEAIGGMLSHTAMVLRGGHRLEIPAEQVVPGDVVFLQPGDRVPADLRLFVCRGLRVEEAVLTGESVPVEKGVDPVAENTSLGDRRSMAWSGTMVTSGMAQGVTVATGEQTEIGRISRLLSEVHSLATPLTRALNRFARQLTLVIGVVSVLAFAFGTLAHDYPPAYMFLAAVAIAVAAIPEGLPPIITITLALGVQRMAARNAIIRKLPAVETLGSVSVICTDKTGTLTRNEMTVQRVAVAGREYRVSGVGYDPHGSFEIDGEEADPRKDPWLQWLCRTGALCSDARLIDGDRGWHVQGDPTEGALVSLALKAGLDPSRLAAEMSRDDSIPFDPERRFMATLHHDHEGHRRIFVKGAPEVVLEMCARQATGDGTVALDAGGWHRRAEEFAGDGLRLIGLAMREMPIGSPAELTYRDLEGTLVFLGIAGLIDPPREEALKAVTRCREAGIRVKMVTGDHLVTARAIGETMGIGDGARALSGGELEQLDDESLRRIAPEVDVYARASPEHKLRLVEALQSDGNVVAMTGDGVNDAPALKRADVGVAMGKSGTEVAREAAKMVLSDDNFASIAHAVEEGRTVYDNIRKAIMYVLPTSVAEAVVILGAILLGRALPITPVQILWVNMVTAVTLSLALAVEPAEGDLMHRTPRRPDAPILDRLLVWRILFVAGILVVGTSGLFLGARADGATLATSRTIAMNTLVMFEAFYLINSRHILAPVLTLEGLVGNRVALLAILAVVTLQLLMTYTPFMQRVFGTAPLSAADWARVVLVAACVLPLVELEKLVLRRSGVTGSG